MHACTPKYLGNSCAGLTSFASSDYACFVFNPMEIKVRIYHDARMAEVIEWCSDRTIPWLLCEQSGMQAWDEKWQWNSFLSDLLAHGLKHGMSKIKVG